MSLSLLQLIGNYLITGLISIMSVFNLGNYQEKDLNKVNTLLEQKSTVVNSIDYEIVTTYNEKLPSNLQKVIKEGQIGLSINEDGSDVTVKDPTSQVVEQGTGKYGISTGKLVGYGPDCKGCSGEGYLACKTKSGTKFSLKYDGIYYTDDEFGKIRILAANTSLFPCGTIVEIKKSDGVTFKAIVLDKIGTQLSNGQTLMDLAYETQTDKTVFGADGLTGSNVTFSVQRWGW